MPKHSSYTSVQAFRWISPVACFVPLLIGAFAVTVPTGAFAAPKDAYVKFMDLDLDQHDPVRITSSDGESYDTIENADIGFTAHIGIDLRHPGAFDGVAIHIGECTGHGGECYTMPVLFSTTVPGREFFSEEPFTRSSGRLATIDTSLRMFATCNGKRSETVGAGGDVTAQLDVGMTLAVDTRISHLKPIVEPGAGLASHGLGLGEYSKTKNFPFKLRLACAPLPLQQQAGPKPISVDIRVKQKGETCPKDADVTAYIDYDKPMTGRFRVIHNGKQGKIIEIKARKMSFAGKTFYRIERLERYKLDPGKHSFKIKVIGGGKSEKKSLDVECPPFKVTSTWLTYEVDDKDTCKKQVTERVKIVANSPGYAPYRVETQGGLVVTEGLAYTTREGNVYVARRTRKLSMGAFDQMMRLKIVNDPSVGVTQTPLKIECLEVLSGKLTLQSLGATSCKGEALVVIHTNGAGDMPYELECGPGKSWQRKVTAMANKIGVDKVRFDVTNNEQVTCALRTRIGGVLKPLDGASMTFQCHKPTDAGASNDLVPETRPEDPPVLDTLAGDFSFVDNGGTKCPRQGKALVNFKTSKPDNVHWSLDCTNGHFSGVAQTAPSPKGGYIAPALVTFDINQTTHAKCALKTVAPGKAKVHTLKGHIFQCVRTTGVGGADDLAPDSRPDPQKPDKPGKVVDPVKPDKPGTSVVDPVKPDEQKPNKATVAEPKLTCANGTVKKGACACEPNFKPVKAGKNAWRCVRSVVDPKPVKPTISEPKIVCSGGTPKNGGCTCARTHKPVKVAKNAWRCVGVMVDPPKNKSGANKLELKTAPKKMSQPKKTTKPKSGAGKTTGLKPKGKAAKKPTSLLAPR